MNAIREPFDELRAVARDARPGPIDVYRARYARGLPLCSIASAVFVEATPARLITFAAALPSRFARVRRR